LDIATLIGIIVSFGLVIISILLGGDGAWFVNAPSLMIAFELASEPRISRRVEIVLETEGEK